MEKQEEMICAGLCGGWTHTDGEVERERDRTKVRAGKRQPLGGYEVLCCALSVIACSCRDWPPSALRQVRGRKVQCGAHRMPLDRALRPSWRGKRSSPWTICATRWSAEKAGGVSMLECPSERRAHVRIRDEPKEGETREVCSTYKGIAAHGQRARTRTRTRAGTGAHTHRMANLRC